MWFKCLCAGIIVPPELPAGDTQIGPLFIERFRFAPPPPPLVSSFGKAKSQFWLLNFGFCTLPVVPSQMAAITPPPISKS